MNVIRDILADRRAARSLFGPGRAAPRVRFPARRAGDRTALGHRQARTKRRRLLDAGSALNHRYILSLPVFTAKKINDHDPGARERAEKAPDNLRLWRPPEDRAGQRKLRTRSSASRRSSTSAWTTRSSILGTPDLKEADTEGYKPAVTELRRLLKPGGKLWITVPFGRYENHGWLQQFDLRMIRSLIELFAGRAAREAYFRYLPDGWQAAGAADCEECRYFDLRKQGDYDADRAAAARAVACLELVK